MGREDWSLLPSTWCCGEAPWCGSGSCRSPNSVKFSQSWEILWRKAAHLFDVLFHCAPTKVSRAIHRITGCLLVALCQFHLRKICQADAEYIHICKRAPFYRATIYFEILCLTSSRIPEKNAWDPWPPAPHSVGEKPGKAGPRGAETYGRKRRTPGTPKRSVKPGAGKWECQKYQAMIRNLAQMTESLWAANLFVTTSESIARPEDLFRLSSNQCWLRLLGRANPSWQVLCAIKLQGVPKKFLIELSFAVALQYLVH